MKAAERMVRLVQSRMRPEDLDRIGKALSATIDDVSTARWDAAQQRAAGLAGDVRPEKLKALTDHFARELAAAGAGAGAMAATPLVGTAATMAAATAELAWFTARAGDLILTIAALHNRPTPTVEERQAWLLAVLIYGSSARDGFSKALNEANTGLTLSTSSKVPMATLQNVNRIMARRLVGRYGTRRGLVALGTALPIGIGAVIGGGANYVAVRRLAMSADQFFARLPYSSVETTAIDVAGALTASPTPSPTPPQP